MSSVLPAPEQRRSLTSNTAWYIAGNVLVKPLWFVYLTVICTRLLTVESYGAFTSALAAGALVALLADLGTTEGAVREASRDLTGADSVLASALSLRVVLGVALLALAAAAALAFPASGMPAVAAGVGYVLLLRLNELLRGFFKAFEVLHLEARSVVAERFLTIVCGWGALLLTASAAWTLGAMCVGVAGSVMYTFALVHLRVTPFRPLAVSARACRRLLRDSVPLAAYQVFSVVFMHSGLVLVRATHDLTVTGHYGTGARIVEAMMLLPSVGIATLWPRLIRAYHSGDQETFRTEQRRLVWLYTGLATLVSALVLPFTTSVLHLITGSEAYSDGAVYLGGYLLLFPLLTLQFLTSMALMATAQQRALLVRVGAWTAGYACAAAALMGFTSAPPIWVLVALGVACTGIGTGNLRQLARLNSR